MYTIFGKRDIIKEPYKDTRAMRENGLKAYRSLTHVFTLQRNMRQSDDPELGAHLDRMGDGECNSNKWRDPCKTTGKTDRTYWSTQMVRLGATHTPPTNRTCV